MAPIDDLAAALNDHQVTDDEGQITGDETPEENTAAPEQTTAEKDATAEKSVDTKDTTPVESKESENEPELVETASDETGKRYVPESRFKEVYAKMKDYERAVKSTPQPTELPKARPVRADKTTQLESELLRATLPQFNPDSPEYSRELDELGLAVYKANPGITQMEAGRQAIDMAKRIQANVRKAEQEAQEEKSIQSDRGITSRVTSREASSDVPKEDASPEEMEQWLKTNGQW